MRRNIQAHTAATTAAISGSANPMTPAIASTNVTTATAPAVPPATTSR